MKVDEYYNNEINTITVKITSINGIYINFVYTRHDDCPIMYNKQESMFIGPFNSNFKKVLR